MNTVKIPCLCRAILTQRLHNINSMRLNENNLPWVHTVPTKNVPITLTTFSYEISSCEIFTLHSTDERMKVSILVHPLPCLLHEQRDVDLNLGFGFYLKNIFKVSESWYV